MNNEEIKKMFLDADLFFAELVKKKANGKLPPDFPSSPGAIRQVFIDELEKWEVVAKYEKSPYLNYLSDIAWEIMSKGLNDPATWDEFYRSYKDKL